MKYIFNIHLPVSGQQSYFQCLAIMNKTAVKMDEQVSL